VVFHFAAARVSPIEQVGKWNGSKIELTAETLCQTTRIKELPNSTNSPHTRTVLPPRTTGKVITKPVTSIPNKRWNMPIKLSSGRRKPIGSP